jgi:hypothetical protein
MVGFRSLFQRKTRVRLCDARTAFFFFHYRR